MYCPNCGAQVPEGQKFCGSCGAPMPVLPPTPAETPPTPTVPPPAPTETPPAPAESAAALPPPLPVRVRRRGKAGIVVAGVLVGLVLILVAAYVLLRSFAPSVLGRIPVVSQWQPCYIQAGDYLKQMEAIAKEWDDANALAANAPRLSLAQPLSALQDIRRRADGLPRPECAERVHTLMVDYMDAQIGSYMAFMAQEPDATVQAKFERSRSIYDLWAGEMAKMSAGESPYDGSASARLASVPEPPEPTALPTLTPTPAPVTISAADVNLDVGDVGAGYTLAGEQDMEGLASTMGIADMGQASDANFRMFQNQAGGAVVSLVFTLKKMATAADLRELTDGFEQGFTGSLTGTTLLELEAPALGDEASLRGASFPDLGMSMYFVSFRKANVIALVVVMGTADYANEAIVGDLAQKLESKVK